MNDIIKIEDFDLENIFTDEKLYENIFIYNIWNEIVIPAKPLRIRFNKTNRFVRVYGETRYLVLFGSKKYNHICNIIRYRINVKSGVTYVNSQ